MVLNAFWNCEIYVLLVIEHSFSYERLIPYSIRRKFDQVIVPFDIDRYEANVIVVT